ncbi:MAG: antibiotic biosynthesis monooxygenase [Desulfobacterales bacterium]|jgi:quinol monooxygenase YgiN
MSLVRSTIRLLIPREKQSEALGILGSMSEQIQFEPGCISCRLYRDVQDEATFMFEEIWASEKELQSHLRSDKYRKLLLVVEMAAEPPDIRFDTIAQSSGVETIKKARNQSEPVGRI